MLLYGGLRVIIDDVTMAKMEEDWSGVRSPSRAIRRRRRGFRQNVKMVKRAIPDAYRMGDTLVMHSATWAKLQHLTTRG